MISVGLIAADACARAGDAVNTANSARVPAARRCLMLELLVRDGGTTGPSGKSPRAIKDRNPQNFRYPASHRDTGESHRIVASDSDSSLASASWSVMSACSGVTDT